MSIKGFEVGGVQAKYDYESLDNIPANLVQDANYVHTDNNYTNADKTKLSGIEAQANKTTIDATLTHSGQAADAKATGDEIGDLKSAFAPNYELTETKVPLTLTVGAIIANGTSYPNYTSYSYSQKISVSPGDVVTPNGDAGAYFRWVCAYNGASVVSSAGLSAGNPVYVVPENIDGIIVTVSNSQNVSAVFVRRSSTTDDLYPISPPLGKLNWKGDISNGSVVELLGSNVTHNTVFNFTGHLTTMGKLSIGTKNEIDGFTEICSVDNTKIYYHEPTSASPIISQDHGLTITGDLQIIVIRDLRVNYLKSIRVSSSGETYSIDLGAYAAPAKGRPCLISDGCVMTDCAFSWIPQDIDKPIWVFGDSWVSMFETRWPYYMVDNGFDKTWLLNGYAGEKSAPAVISLENLLSIRKPQYILWTLGMNNADTSSEVNAEWKTAFDRVIALCTQYKITPILYTVPNTPTINNNFKNAIVRASGYRYFDACAAVGDDGNGNWFTGYESSSTDHNHTSRKGAKALFHRLLADFPEIAGNGL